MKFCTWLTGLIIGNSIWIAVVSICSVYGVSFLFTDIILIAICLIICCYPLLNQSKK